MRGRFAALVLFPALLTLAVLMAGCAARYDVEVFNRLGVRPPIARADFERRLPRGWRHEIWGFYGRVQKEQYLVGPAEGYDVWSYPRRILTTHADDALMKIKHFESRPP